MFIEHTKRAQEPDSLASHIALLRQEDVKNPLVALYDATDSSDRVDGSAVIPALHRYIESLRTEGLERVTDEILAERMSFMQEYAEALFSSIPTVTARKSSFYPERGSREVALQAVVFYGSYLRGKLNPGDLDVKVVIPFQEPHYVLDFLMGYNESQDAVHAAIKQSKLPKSVTVATSDIPIRLEADSNFGESNDLQLVTGGPFLVFIPGTHGHVHMFGSFTGTHYLESRTP